MTRRSSAALAFAITLVAALNLSCAQASTPDATPAAVHSKTAGVSPWARVAAPRKIHPLPTPHTENRGSALTTAEMIYMHELLVSNLVSVTPAAVPAPPVRRCRPTTSSATQECS